MYWAQRTGLGLSRRGRAGSSLDNSCELKEEKEFQHQVCYPSEPEGLLAKGKPPSSFPSSIAQIRLQGRGPTASVCTLLGLAPAPSTLRTQTPVEWGGAERPTVHSCWSSAPRVLGQRHAVTPEGRTQVLLGEASPGTQMGLCTWSHAGLGLSSQTWCPHAVLPVPSRSCIHS